PVALRAVALQELAVDADAVLDEVLRRFQEHRAPLFGVGLQQDIAAPALEPGGELPPQIGDIIKTVVEAVAAIGRMAVGGIAGEEDAAHLIFLCHRNTQIPEADIVELAGELEAGGLLQQPVKVVVFLGGVRRNRSVEEEPLTDVDPPEEPPEALQVRMQRTIGGARREALESLVQLARAEHCQHHELIEVRAGAGDAELAADGGMATVAAYQVVRLDQVATLAALLDDAHARAVGVLLD